MGVKEYRVGKGLSFGLWHYRRVCGHKHAIIEHGVQVAHPERSQPLRGARGIGVSKLAAS